MNRTGPAAGAKLLVGLERLAAEPRLAAKWGRIGLLANQASVTRDFRPAWDVLRTVAGERLVSLFGPQHGFEATAQDNMIETTHARHIHTGLPVYSLYSETREPTAEMLFGLDTLVIDLQITGCRIYTWKATIGGCLRAAKKLGKRIVILDRPNPVGGELLEGRVLDDDCHSFVGQVTMPMRHGLTAGEAALLFNATIGAELEVIALKDWQPAHYWQDLDRPWVLTSPNLPTPDAVYVYPGTVMFEGTNLSEGRGTGLPFQLIGAPYLRTGRDLIERVKELIGETPGIHMREAGFEPTSQKWKGEVCNGVHLHVLDHREVRSFRLTLAIIKAAMDLGGGRFAWKDPPYEYDFKTLPMKLIAGGKAVTDHISLTRFDPQDSYWRDGIGAYITRVAPLLLYPRTMLDVT